jgi:ribonuclease P protein component
MSDFSFKKEERLSSKKTITFLFQSGSSVMSFPVKILFTRTEMGQYPASVAIVVPKRLFKKAVDRNLIKRRIREAYRLNKSDFYPKLIKEHIGLNLVIQYQHRKIVDYQTIKKGLHKGLERIINQIREQSGKPVNE